MTYTIVTKRNPFQQADSDPMFYHIVYVHKSDEEQHTRNFSDITGLAIYIAELEKQGYTEN